MIKTDTFVQACSKTSDHGVGMKSSLSASTVKLGLSKVVDNLRKEKN